MDSSRDAIVMMRYVQDAIGDMCARSTPSYMTLSGAIIASISTLMSRGSRTIDDSRMTSTKARSMVVKALVILR